MEKKKADPVMIRIGFSDVIISQAENDDENHRTIGEDTYIVGYEDEEGNECDKEGNYFK